MRFVIVIAAAAALLVLPSCSRNGAVTSPADALRLDAKSPLDRPFRLKGAKATDVAALAALMPGPARPTWEKAAFDSRLGATVVTGVAFPDPDGAGPRRGLTAKRVELYGVDLDAIRRASAGPRNAAAPFETLWRKVRAYDVAPDAGAAAPQTIKALEIDEVKARRGALAPLDGEARATPAHFLNNFDVAGVYLKDFRSGGGAAGGPQISVTLPDFRLAGLAGGKLEGVVFRDAEYRVVQTEASRMAAASAFGPQAAFLLSGPLGRFLAPLDQRVTVASFEWRKIDASGWTAKTLKGGTPGRAETGLLSLGTIRARTIETHVGGRRAVRSEEATLDARAFAGTTPTRLESRSKSDLYDFTAYVDPKEKAAIDVLKKNGFDKAKGKSAAAWTWDPAKGDAGIAAEFDSDRLLDAALAFDMADASAAKMDAAAASGGRGDFFSVGAFKGFSLTLKDKALLSTLFELSALSAGRPAADLRKEAPEQLRALAAASPGPRLRAVVEAAAAFVEKGGVLTITARPAAPVPFAAMGATNPVDLSETLQLTATHEPPAGKGR